MMIRFDKLHYCLGDRRQSPFSLRSRRRVFMNLGFASEFADYIPVKFYAQAWSFGRREIASGNRHWVLDNIAKIPDGTEAFARIRQIRHSNSEVSAGSCPNPHLGLAADNTGDIQLGGKRKDL